MPTVLTFWQTREDEEVFIEYLNGTGDVVAFPFGKHRTESELSPRALQESLRGDGRSVLCTFAEHKEEVTINTFRQEGKEEFSVSPILSPVIAYESGSLSNRGLTATNVYAYWQTRVGEGEAQKWIEKPEWFVTWGKGVFRWLRKRTKQRLKGKDLPMTASVVTAVAEGLDLQDSFILSA